MAPIRPLIAFLLIFILSASAQAACVPVFGGMDISGDTVFCPGKYSISTAIIIEQDNIEIDCGGAQIECAVKMYPGLLVEASDVTLKNCEISGCQNGIALRNAAQSQVLGNRLTENNIGISVQGSDSVNISGNELQRNSQSIYSIASALDREYVLAHNTYDLEPQIQTIKVIQYDAEELEAQIAAQNYAQAAPGADDTGYAVESGPRPVTVTIGLAKEILLEEDPHADIEDKLEHILNLDEVSDLVEISREFEYGNGMTTVRITITPKKDLKDFRYYEKIPKCLAEHIKELMLTNDIGFRVITEDPLVVWRFDELDRPQTLTYSVRKAISPDCADALIGLGIGKKNINVPLFVTIPLAVVIGLMLIIKIFGFRNGGR